MRGADALIATLARRGIDTVFGVPGGAVLPLEVPTDAECLPMVAPGTASVTMIS